MQFASSKQANKQEIIYLCRRWRQILISKTILFLSPKSQSYKSIMNSGLSWIFEPRVLSLINCQPIKSKRKSVNCRLSSSQLLLITKRILSFGDKKKDLLCKHQISVLLFIGLCQKGCRVEFQIKQCFIFSQLSIRRGTCQSAIGYSVVNRRL